MLFITNFVQKIHTRAISEQKRAFTGMGIEVNENCLTTLLFVDNQVTAVNDEYYIFRKLVNKYQK